MNNDSNKGVAMDKLQQLLINDYEVTMLWALVSESREKTFQELNRRHVIRQDGERNKGRKYLGAYEEGLLEEYEYLLNMESMLFEKIPAEDFK